MAVPRLSSLPFQTTRPQNRTSNKLIFISCEGSVTEWEYFEKIINLSFVNISSKVKVINVLEDVLKKRDKIRTKDEHALASSSSPKNLLQNMDDYINLHKDEYNIDNHSEDEFWLIMDIDDHTNASIIDDDGVSNLDKWNFVLSQCQEKKYQCAVSNPFFELWLLIHFDDINDDDRKFAVTDLHPYQPTNHFKERLRNLGVPLKDKHIRPEDFSKYNKNKINDAISRAEALDSKSKCDYPTDLGSTVYRLLKSIAEIDAQYEIN